MQEGCGRCSFNGATVKSVQHNLVRTVAVRMVKLVKIQNGTFNAQGGTYDEITQRCVHARRGVHTRRRVHTTTTRSHNDDAFTQRRRVHTKTMKAREGNRFTRRQSVNVKDFTHALNGFCNLVEKSLNRHFGTFTILRQGDGCSHRWKNERFLIRRGTAFISEGAYVGR
jgi:hypothetical protein